MKESKKMIDKEISFMKKKGAPKSMLRHEVAEKAAEPKKFATGGVVRGKGCATRGTGFGKNG